MASREAEKEARRKARLEQEAQERAAEARRKRLQMVLAGVLVLGVIAAAVIGIGGALGGDDKSGDGGNATQASANGVTLPEQQIGDVEEAAKAAGCTLTHPASEGQQHEDREFTAEDYKTNPPTSGVHFPVAAQDGVYDADNAPPLGQLVHTLEHGRINIQYKPGTDAQTVAKLEALVAEEPYHMVMYQNPTGMDAQVAATAWTHSLTCDRVTDKTWDALRTFRDRYIDKAPERVP
jgi:hypothetical protein